jgi:hypothetical protein
MKFEFPPQIVEKILKYQMS